MTDGVGFVDVVDFEAGLREARVRRLAELLYSRSLTTESCAPALSDGLKEGCLRLAAVCIEEAEIFEVAWADKRK